MIKDMLHQAGRIKEDNFAIAMQVLNWKMLIVVLTIQKRCHVPTKKSWTIIYTQRFISCSSQTFIQSWVLSHRVVPHDGHPHHGGVPSVSAVAVAVAVAVDCWETRPSLTQGTDQQ